MIYDIPMLKYTALLATKGVGTFYSSTIHLDCWAAAPKEVVEKNNVGEYLTVIWAFGVMNVAHIITQDRKPSSSTRQCRRRNQMLTRCNHFSGTVEMYLLSSGTYNKRAQRRKL